MRKKREKFSPKIKIKMQPSDYILELAAVGGLVFLVGATYYYYPTLPERIPTRFNFQGEPEAFGAKSSIWIFPGMAFLLYVILTVTNFFPQTFNFPCKVTEENAERLYRFSMRIVRWAKALILLSFCYINGRTIEVSLAHQAGEKLPSGLGEWFLVIFLAVIVIFVLAATVGTYLVGRPHEHHPS